MAEKLNLSRNELWALLIKVFEALFGHRRDYYDMARTLLWLECHGHEGVRQLVEGLSILEDNSLPEPSLTKISDTHFVMDGGGRSLLDLGPSLSDLAIVCAAENGNAHIDVMNVESSEALLGALPFMARQGFNGVAIGPKTVSVIAPMAACPNLYKSSAKEQLSLICKRDGIDVSEHYAYDDQLLKSQIMQTEFFSETLENGIDILASQVDGLKAVASRVLVEATEASRRGAGE
jgi:hypothetical protein